LIPLAPAGVFIVSGRSGKYLRSGLTSYPVQSDCRPEITGRRQIGMPPEMKWSHEMARTKTSPDTARSVAHAAPDPAPAPGAAPAAGSPAAAVHAALAANPGSAVAVIADVAGTGKPAARAALLAMEQAGTATRVKGIKPGIPDTWTVAEPAPDGTSPAADPQAGQAGQPGEDPGSPDGAAEDETAGGTGQDRTAETGDPAPEDGDDAEAGTSDAPDPEAAESGPRDDASAEDDHEDAVPGGQDDEAAPGSDPDDGDARTTRTPRRTPAAKPAMRRTRPSSRT
jgi:hypothetical protein